MVATYSPHRESGGTLHLPSPTHIHHVDPTSALSQLRRSLSRSPSKGPTFRLVMSKSTSPSPSSPLSASPLSPQKRSESANTQSQTGFALPSSLAVHLPASTKKNRSNARKLSPMRNSSRSSSSHRSPMKRALSDSTNSGNATPPSSGDFNPGIENRSPSPDDTMVMDTSSGLFSSQYNDPSILNPTLARFEKSNGSHGGFSAKSSPLKRSDGTMNLDQAFLGSPSAKRRSLHGAPFGPDFNIFDHEAVVSTQPEPRRSTDGPAYPESNTFELPSLQSPMPKRTSSLRKTTLQQRWEKPSLFKLRPNVDLAVEFATPSQQAPSKGRHRMSLENFLPAMGRESPFSSQGSLLNASVHPMTTQRKESQDTGVQGRASRHPLSRTITQSSSSSSMAEDSPTHVPFRQPEHKRKSLDFSKSLPVGAGRPFQRAPLSHEISNQTSSTETSFATPENYKLAKPLPAAFMSTGLISKRNKIIDDGPSGMHAITTNMPDTPCKRPNGMTSVSPIPAPDSAAGKARLRHSMHSFGTPSTPFNPHPTRPTSGMFGKSVSIFGSKFASGSVPRRGSFVSNEGDENSQSPPTKGDSQSSTDCELPRTPTKSALGPSGMQSGDGISGRKSLLSPEAASRYGAIGAQPSRLEQSCKSSPKGTLRRSVDGDSDSMVEDSPSACLRSRHITSISSQSTRPYLFRISTSPTPLPKKPHTVHSLNLKKEKTKRSPLSPASPINDQFPPMSPHTPQEGILPPDPSGLSISGHRGGLVRQPSNTFNNSFSSSVSAAPPVTPTSKDYFSQFGKRRSSITPVHNASVTDVDLSLISRFDKVEPIGTGEFSQVFRVSQKADQNSVHGSTNVRPSPKLPMPDRVWAVKKSRHPYIGARDRKKKLQEVEVLRMLGQSDHIVQLVDSWENKDHLYIQTEFCEEGSLDVFLDQVGRKARLDDFRIWKILLELSLGLKHIHDHGFMHLDLKPANVLVTFEGVLKIADFGMATPWPAPPGIDGEGDREYIGPEVLMGQFDRPADIFALGLVMLEIAGNVMLPDNGVSWQRLRSGDMSDVPSLSWSSETSTTFRDSSGKPISREESYEEMFGSNAGSDNFGSPNSFSKSRFDDHHKNSRVQLLRSGELANPPSFMTDADNEEALDKIVRWMISPQPSERPIADQILNTVGVQWAQNRRRAGATIFEGNWGPADDVLADDAEMIDV